MTYDELAEMRGIKRIGAVRLVQRYKWRRQAGNDGRARVLVPHDAMEKVRGSDAGDDAGTSAAPTDAGNGAGTGAATMMARGLAALEDAVQVLREQLAAERQGKERAEAAVAGERSRSDVLRSRLNEMIEARAEADRAIAEERLRADAAHAAAQAAQQAAEQLRQADEARRARGRLRRVLAAWRGE